MLNRTVLLLLAFSAGAALASEPKAERASYNPFTDKEEAIIGATLAKKFDVRYRLLRNPIGEAYLNDIGMQLAARSQRPELDCVVRVIDSREVNAFSLPGGHIYVTVGLLEFVGTESELVGTISHEVGHVVGRHVLNRLVRYSAVQAIVDQARANNIVLSDTLAERIAGAAINAVYTLFERSFDRDEELEADLLGFYQMGRATWNPTGMVTFYERIQRLSPRYGPAMKLLATHPEPGERAARLRDEMTEVLLPKSLKQDSIEFQIMKRGLAVIR